MSQEDYQENHEQQQKPNDVPTITESQQQEAQYMLELTKMKANIAANSKTIAALTKQLAQTALKDKEAQ